MQMKILNSREIKGLVLGLKEQYAITNIDLNYALLRDEDKVFLISKDYIIINGLNLRNAGLYFGRIVDDGIILGIEGSQIIGNNALRVIELNKEETIEWMKGNDIDAGIREEGYYLIKNKNDFFGVGKVKNNKVWNMVPRDRRIYNFSSIGNQSN